LVGYQNPSGRCRENKNFLLLPETESRFLGISVYSLVAIPTELYQPINALQIDHFIVLDEQILFPSLSSQKASHCTLKIFGEEYTYNKLLISSEIEFRIANILKNLNFTFS
jgi:hypothetical protein